MSPVVQFSSLVSFSLLFQTRVSYDYTQEQWEDKQQYRY